MLKEVIRPDRSNVQFKYDPLGRRIEKTVTVMYGDKTPKKKHRKDVRFLWDGNVLLHEWEEDSASGTQISEAKVIHKADYVLKLEREEKEKAREEVQKGKKCPEGLITWVFQDDFIPRGKITKERNYSIISDYLGTPAEAYDEIGEKVWEQKLDIYGRVKSSRKDIQGRTERESCEENFIPFRFQGQYEDEETGLYYNRFRYYSPEDGRYTQQDPIGLAGGMNLYSYVKDSNSQIDVWGWEDIVYRCLHVLDIENIKKGLGLIPKDGSAHASVIEHVLRGSTEGYADQFLSFTRDEGLAMNWAIRNNIGVVSIDLDAIHNNILDLSTAEGRLAYIGDAGRAAPGSDIHTANKLAKGADEVLVEGSIPYDKLIGDEKKIKCPG